MSAPKVSVVIPCYNVEKYVRQCVESVVNQTLKDIEIICVNDGSTDSTLSILREYESHDNRIKIIDKPNSGYGNSMNQGFDLASGEYIGIVESDDFVEPDMYEKLYFHAKKDDLDVSRGGFYYYSTNPEERNVPGPLAVRVAGEDVFCPLTDLKDPMDMVDFFKTQAAIWSAIYSRDFIRGNQIRFLETPGASFQDCGFNFKVWVKAKRVKLVKEYLLHYRVDNAGSSVHNPGKVYCICDEYAEMRRFLEESCQEKELLSLMCRLQYEHYLWNYERLSQPLQAEFILYFADTFRKSHDAGELSSKWFDWYTWNNLQKIMLDPQRYHQLHVQRCNGEASEDFYDAYPEKRPVRSRVLYRLKEKMALVQIYLRDEGLTGTVKQVIHKIR